MSGKLWILLLEKYQSFSYRGRLNPSAYFHPTGRQVAQDIPPFWVVLKRWVCHTSDETWNFE
jgi:hypothetical protein